MNKMLMGKNRLISEYIREYNHDNITKSKLQFKNFEACDDHNIIIPFGDIIEKYKNDLKEFVYVRTLTPEEERKWFYNPKVMSYELYGTTELWFTILSLNELMSATQFAINPVKVYNATILVLLSRIYALEKSLLDENEDEITKKMLE